MTEAGSSPETYYQNYVNTSRATIGRPLRRLRLLDGRQRHAALLARIRRGQGYLRRGDVRRRHGRRRRRSADHGTGQSLQAEARPAAARSTSRLAPSCSRRPTSPTVSPPWGCRGMDRCSWPSPTRACSCSCADRPAASPIHLTSSPWSGTARRWPCIRAAPGWPLPTSRVSCT